MRSTGLDTDRANRDTEYLIILLDRTKSRISSSITSIVIHYSGLRKNVLEAKIFRLLQ